MPQYATIVTKERGAVELAAELDPDGAGFIYGGVAARCWGALSRIAEQLGLTPLNTFQWDGENEEEEAAGPWHDPSVALRTVTGILQFIDQSSPDQLRRHFNESFIEQDLAHLIFDLRACEIILRQAMLQSDQIRILIC